MTFCRRPAFDVLEHVTLAGPIVTGTHPDFISTEQLGYVLRLLVTWHDLRFLSGNLLPMLLQEISSAWHEAWPFFFLSAFHLGRIF